MQQDARPPQHLEQFVLPARKTCQKLVEVFIAAAQREDAREAFVECGGKAGRGLSFDALERPVEPPHEIAHRLDLTHLSRRCRHQLLQQPLRADPTQGMVADPELAGIGDRRVAEKTRRREDRDGGWNGYGQKES